MNKQLFIYHYNPIELYPPIINFLDFLSNSLGKDWDVLVFTTYASSSVEPYSIKSDNIQIIRKGTGFKRGKQFQNLWSLICFNVYGILLHRGFLINIFVKVVKYTMCPKISEFIFCSFMGD